MLISTMMLMMVSFTNYDFLTGKWVSQPSVNGNITGVVFKEDNSFEGFVNRKPFVSGNYTLKDSIFTFTDNGCDGKSGTYKINLFSNGDSLRFVPVNDSCEGRRNGMSRLVLGKIK